MAGVREFDFWKSLDSLTNVVLSLSPLFVFSVITAAAICAVFMWGLPRLSERFGYHSLQQPAPAPVLDPNNPQPAPPVPPRTGAASTLSYVLMASLLGLIVGMLVNQVGGLEALSQSASGGTFVEGIASTLLVVIGAVGTLLADGSEVEIRRPMGLTAFLSSFLVSCLYWVTFNA